MPKLNVDVSHALAQDEATRRLKDHFHNVRESYQAHVSGLEERWGEHQLDFAFTTYGMKVKGNVTSAPSKVSVKADLPMMAAMFKGAIEQQIRAELGRVLT